MPGCPISIYFVSKVVALWLDFLVSHRFLNLNGLALYSLTIRR
jgi:hypothetical protein